jgi:hypothetical protein
MTRAREALRMAALQLSHAPQWGWARTEWRYVDSFMEPGGTCPCGQHPITEHCVIANQITGQSLEVGNCCVRHFWGEEWGKHADSVFSAIRRLRKRPDGPTPDVLLRDLLLNRHRVLSDWERQFLDDLGLKRVLTPRQRAYRHRANLKILRHYVRNDPTIPPPASVPIPAKPKTDGTLFELLGMQPPEVQR